MTESINIGPATLVLVEGIKWREIYEKLREDEIRERETIAAIVVETLTPLLPEYLTGVTPGETELNVYSSFEYSFDGNLGRTEVRAEFQDDLAGVVDSYLRMHMNHRLCVEIHKKLFF